jgi:uncharacterized damage-inducible protein DinB
MARMLAILRDLVAHKGHANAALLQAVRQNDSAASDPEIRQLFDHMLLANRFWLQTINGLPFAVADEAHRASSFDAMSERYESIRAQEIAWLGVATEEDLTRTLENPMIPGGKCSVAQAFLQVCLHSHGHRAQCAKLLRQHGGVPPPTDFILWLASRNV